MYRIVLLFLILGFDPAILQSKAAGSVESSQNEPLPDTPPKLIEVWLHFHEADLCQGIDAVFVFNKGGMEIWSQVEDERSYQKLIEIIEQLRGSYRVELFATRPPSEKKSEDDIPFSPGLWENYELRANLGDPVARGYSSATTETQVILDQPNEMFQQLLLIFSEQTLDRNRKMARYAAELPPLVRMALNHAANPDIQLLAKRVCLAHAQNLSKYIGKLNANLKQALPKTGKELRERSRSDKPGDAAKAPVDRAVQISEAAQRIAQQVHSFINSDDHTVELEELRSPSLLHSLAGLQKLDEDFQRAMGMRTSK